MTRASRFLIGLVTWVATHDGIRGGGLRFVAKGFGRWGSTSVQACTLGSAPMTDGEVAGLTVAIRARISSLAAPSEVLVSRTVEDLVAGSGLAFEDAGEHELRGVPDRRHLYRVVE